MYETRAESVWGRICFVAGVDPEQVVLEPQELHDLADAMLQGEGPMLTLGRSLKVRLLWDEGTLD